MKKNFNFWFLVALLGCLSLPTSAQFMPLAFWKTQGVSLPSGPCDSANPTIGIACGDGTIYIGKDASSNKILITQGGCGYEPAGSSSTSPSARFTATCAGGADTINKPWATTNFNTASGATSTTDGAGNTYQAAIGAGFTDTAAARYCHFMSYAGYTDWYLPSQAELNLLFTNQAAVISTTGNSGFVVNNYYYYATSTEIAANTSSTGRLLDGSSSQQYVKNQNSYVHCMRKMGVYFIGSAAPPGNYTVDMTATGINYDYTGPVANTYVLTVKNAGNAASSGVSTTITSGFSVTGGTCSAGTPLLYQGTCTIEIQANSTGRLYNGTVTGRLKIFDNTRFTYIGLTGTTSNAPDQCAPTNPTLGATCIDGTIYVGKDASSNKLVVAPGNCGFEPSGTTATAPSANFTPTCTGATDTTSSARKAFGTINTYIGTSTSDGTTNTATLATAGSPAANYCKFNRYAGKTGWFLPSKDELNILFTNRDALLAANSNFGLSADGSSLMYWSSSELNAGQPNFNYGQRFYDGASQPFQKSETYVVRCMRRY